MAVVDDRSASDAVVRRLAQVLDADATAVGYVEGGRLRLFGMYGYTPASATTRWARARGCPGRPGRSAGRWSSPDVRREPGYLAGNPAIRSGVYVPGKARGQVALVIAAESTRVGAYTAKDVLLIAPVADLLASMLESRRMLREAEQLEERLLTLVGHEMRTPLTTIFGTLTTLRNYAGRVDDGSREDLLDGMRVVTLPLRIRFRGVDHREVVLLRGPAGWGEFGPFLEYDTAESSRWLAAAIEAAWEGWPAATSRPGRRQRHLPAVPPDQVAGVLARYDGCGTVKVKVAEPGQSLADDVDRVAATRDAAGAGREDPRRRQRRLGRRRGGPSHHGARRYDLEYAEQPCPSVDDLKELRVRLARNGIDVPIAADESIRKAEDPIRVAREGAADIVIVKVPPLGGVRRALEISAECGLPTVVSSALDSSVGMAAGVALAAALPRAAVCVRARHRRAARRPTWPTTGSCRSAARCRSARRGPTRTSSPRRPRAPDRVDVVAGAGVELSRIPADRAAPRS